MMNGNDIAKIGVLLTDAGSAVSFELVKFTDGGDDVPSDEIYFRDGEHQGCYAALLVDGLAVATSGAIALSRGNDDEDRLAFCRVHMGWRWV